MKIHHPHHLTMMDSEHKCEPFKLITYQKSAKKPRMELEELTEVQFQFETAVRIIYKKPAKHGTQVPIAANVKTFITTMMQHNLVLTIPTLDKPTIYHPINDVFPLWMTNSKILLHSY